MKKTAYSHPAAHNSGLSPPGAERRGEHEPKTPAMQSLAACRGSLQPLELAWGLAVKAGKGLDRHLEQSSGAGVSECREECLAVLKCVDSPTASSVFTRLVPVPCASLLGSPHLGVYGTYFIHWLPRGGSGSLLRYLIRAECFTPFL